MTKTGTVATFGGLNIPPVTIYMDGFWEGVQYYNQQKGKNVQVLGWNETNQKGGTFAQLLHRPEPGQADQPDVHPAGRRHHLPGRRWHRPRRGRRGAGLRRQGQRHLGRHRRLRVGGAVLPVFLTSVTKNLSDSVKEYVTKAAGGSFPTGSYVGTLANNGTGLAPFHDFDSKVPADLKSELKQIQSDITSGKIKITSPSQPTS